MLAWREKLGNSGYSMTAQDIAKFYLLRASDDGDLITHLKMQKLVYYAYVWSLVRIGKKPFDEAIEAWPNGPVVPSLYHELKQYKSMPIDEEYIGDAKAIDNLIMSSEYADALNQVYEEYAPMSAFELVTLSHSEDPWANARSGKKPTDTSSAPIKDSDIVAYYG